NVWNTYSSSPAKVGRCRLWVRYSDFHRLTVDGNTTYGSRTMWTKRASGKSSSKTLIRQLCGGDFRTRRLGFLKRRRWRKLQKASFQAATFRGGTPSRSRYSGYCGGWLGKAMVR